MRRLLIVATVLCFAGCADPNQGQLAVVPKLVATQYDPNKPLPTGMKVWPDEKNETPRDLSQGYVDIGDPPNRVHILANDWIVTDSEDKVVWAGRPEAFRNRYRSLGIEIKELLKRQTRIRIPSPDEVPVPREP